MAITTKTVTGKIVIPGTTIGIRATVTATPMTTANALTFPADDTISWGPVSTTTNAAGILTPALAIPTSQAETAVMWKVVAEPIDKHPGLPKSWTLGYYTITGTGTVDLADLVEIDVTAIDPGTIVSVQQMVTDAEAARDAAQAAQAAAEAVGSTNDTIIAGRVNDPTSATRTALSATIASANAGGALGVAVDPEYLGTTTYPIGSVGDILYGSGGTRSLDGGNTWTVVTGMPGGHSVAQMGNGEMVVINDTSVKVSTGWATNPNTATWATKCTPTTDGGVHPDASFIKSDWDVYGQYVLIGEYAVPDRYNSRKIRFSTDYGQTFTEILDLNTFYPAGEESNTHIHAVCIDPFTTTLGHPRLWWSHGDFGTYGHGVHYSDDLGATWVDFHGAAGSDWDPFTSNAMTLTATKRGMVIGTDSNAPDGIFHAQRDTADNPANWVIKRGATIGFDHVAGSLLGFTERSWRDDRTGLVWVIMRATHPGTVTTPLPARIFVSDGQRAEIAWETPEAGVASGTVITVQTICTALGKLFFTYSTVGSSTPNKVVRLNPGGRGGKSYQDMNRGNQLRGLASSRAGVAVGYGARSLGLSVSVGAGATDTNDSNVTIGYQAVTAGNGTAVGYTANAGSHSNASGYQASATTEAISIGSQSKAWLNSTAIGRGANAGTASTTAAAVAIGRNTVASANGAVVVGGGTASGVNSVLVGSGSATSTSSIGIGNGSGSTGSRSITIGDSAVGNTTGSVAIGYQASSTHSKSYALGYQVATTATDQLALGPKHFEFAEVGEPGAPAVDAIRFYAVDNGSGQTELRAKFNGSKVVTLAGQYGSTKLASFTTVGRPAAATAGAGAAYFDTTLNKPGYSTGAAWVDATGATI